MGNTNGKTAGTDGSGKVRSMADEIEKRIEEDPRIPVPKSVVSKPAAAQPAAETAGVVVDADIVDEAEIEREVEEEVPEPTGETSLDRQDVEIEDDSEVENEAEAEEEGEDEVDIEAGPETSGFGSMFGGLATAAYNTASYLMSSTAADSAEDSAAVEADEPYEAPVVGHTEEGKEMRLRQDGTIDVDTSVSGAKFKEMYTNCRVVKLTNESCCHNDFQFQEGLNEDTNAFDYNGECGPDGLYFCTERQAEYWFDYRDDISYVWDVEIPDDARVCVYDQKLKVDKFILSNKRTLADFICERVRKMVHNDRTFGDVFDYINRNAHFIGEDFEILTDPICDLINIDPPAYYSMPNYLRTEGVKDEAEKLGMDRECMIEEYDEEYYENPCEHDDCAYCNEE
jgi:hypothetical protein